MAIANTVSDPSAFHSDREFAAWLGLTAKSHSSSGKDKLGWISKRGDRYIRNQLYVGVRNVICFSKARAASDQALIEDLQSWPPKVVIIAVANKVVRIAWALMMRVDAFRSSVRTATA